MISKKVIESLKNNREKRLHGDIIAIPWSLKKLSTLIPGVERGKYYLVAAGMKNGKCLAKDTLIRMYDNSLKKVQDIKIGDALLNPTGEDPNIVTSTCIGEDIMYEIKQSWGVKYTVNSDHILSLKSTFKKGKTFIKDKVYNMSVKEYLKLTNTDKKRLKGYRSENIDFPHQPITIDPYYLGLWLGDGDKDQASITNIDFEVIDYIYAYAKQLLLKVSVYKSKNHVNRYNIVSNSKKTENYLLFKLKEYNLLFNKHIPEEYLTNDKNTRLKLLAGLVDSDGYIINNKGCRIEIASVSKQLTDDIKQLCNSLGFRVNITLKIVKNKTYYRILISGNHIDDIPILIKRKKEKLSIIKNRDISTSSLQITELPKDNYYGFTLTGNKLFCLEDYTVTHNTQLTDFLFVMEPIEWYIRTKPKIKLKVLYFSLEMSKESKILQAMSYKLNKDYNISISPQYLKSTFNGYILDNKILSIINSSEFQNWLIKYESVVTYIDDIRNPEGIYNFVKHYAEKNGKYIIEKDNIVGYIPNDKDEHVIIVCDHLSLLTPNSGETLHNAMYRYSAYHCLEFRDRFNYTVVNVQQMSASSNTQQFDYRGNSIIEKIRPSPEGLADMKLSSRDL